MLMSDRKIKAMHNEYGRLDGHMCSECCNLSSYTQSRTWFKCEVYGNSNGESTDWAKRYIACGMFNIPLDKSKRIPLIEKLKHEPRKNEDEPIEGQINLL